MDDASTETFSYRWLKAAALADGKDRLDFLTTHVAEVRHRCYRPVYAISSSTICMLNLLDSPANRTALAKRDELPALAQMVPIGPLAGLCPLCSAAETPASRLSCAKPCSCLRQVHLWTLAQREGTPCVPMIIALRCNKESHCSGLGDRMFSLGSAFWLVWMASASSSLTGWSERCLQKAMS